MADDNWINELSEEPENDEEIEQDVDEEEIIEDPDPDVDEAEVVSGDDPEKEEEEITDDDLGDGEGEDGEGKTDDMVPLKTFITQRDETQDLKRTNDELMARLDKLEGKPDDKPKDFGPTSVADLDKDDEEVVTKGELQEINENLKAKTEHDADVDAKQIFEDAAVEIAKTLTTETQGEGLDYDSVATNENFAYLNDLEKLEIVKVADPVAKLQKAYDLMVENAPHLKALKDKQSSSESHQQAKPDKLRDKSDNAQQDDAEVDDPGMGKYMMPGAKLADDLLKM